MRQKLGLTQQMKDTGNCKNELTTELSTPNVILGNTPVIQSDYTGYLICLNCSEGNPAFSSIRRMVIYA